MKEGWTYKKLGEVATITMGQSPSSDTYNESEGLPFFQGNADFGKEHPNVRLFCNAPIRIADIDDVLISVRAPIGAINIADRRCCIGRGLASLRGNENYHSRFIYYFLIASKEKLVAQGTGSTFKSIGKDALYSLLIPAVSLSEQSHIVNEFDLLLSIIDKQKAQLKELDNLAKAVFYDMFGDKNCTKKSLGEVVRVQSGLVSPLEAPYCDMIHIGPANIESNTGKLMDLKTAKEENLISGKYFFDTSMVLYSKIRPNLNKVTIAPFEGICSADMYPLKPTNELDKSFLLFILKQKDFLDYAVSNSGRANIPKINREALLNYKIILPPLSLQQSFAAKIESIEKQKAAINKSIAESQKLFDYTMDKYFG